MSEVDRTEADVETSVSDSVRKHLEAQEPSAEEKRALRKAHDGHLVRDTTSQLSVDPDEPGPGMEVEADAEIPDTYCFTCEAWIGFSGVDLRGTPRSRRDAYYLGGMPADVRRAKAGTEDTLGELADALTDRVGHLDSRGDAYEFIATTLEEVRADANGGGA
ncbi:hypothetical protein [Halostella litorea]|uniref:hypothetical protein n=1 Tax=Halostella litorea TaxID=2528831 RepID=UPI001092161D|nr:hypothetical protein [Halostella litorea]